MIPECRIIIDLGDETEGEHLASLLKAGVGNTDPGKGPVGILNVLFQKRVKPKPMWTWENPVVKLDK